MGVPEYRFWFFVVDDVPRLAVEPNAGMIYVADATLAVDVSDAFERCLVAIGITLPAEAIGTTPTQRAASACAMFRPAAESLAREMVPNPVPFQPGRNLTEMAVWFTDESDERLVVVVGRHETTDSLDQVLAYALAWQGDRDLVLVLPETHAEQTMTRLPWIDSSVRLFVYGLELLPRPTIIPARTEVLSKAKTLGIRRTKEHTLGDVAELIEPLVKWADEHWALKEAHRRSYLAWHCEGRQVLAVARSKGGVKITAGVTYKDPPAGEELALVMMVRSEIPLTRSHRAEIEARVGRAIWKRLDGHDQSHVEHWLQGSLQAGPLRRRLGLTELRREYPAWRGNGRPGFLDFLGVDRDNRLHIVETKVNPDDVTVILQALDYAIWTKANGAEIRTDQQWAKGPDDEQIVIDFICAPRVRRLADGRSEPYGHAIGSYLAGQLEVLAPAVTWRIWLVADPLAEEPTLSSPSWRSLPQSPLVARPVTPPRWPARIQTALSRDGSMTKHVSPAAALLPAARPILTDLSERGLSHRWVLSVRSSQALALNLFAPLNQNGIREVFGHLGIVVDGVEPPEFEYSDPHDRLGERSVRSPHQTQVDVVLRATATSGTRVVALIEVKFTEEFGTCSAYDSSDNDTRDVCRSSGLFGDQPIRCFQLRNHGIGRRHYDAHLGDIPVRVLQRAADAGGCVVRGSLSQPMRNLALAHLLISQNEADLVAFAVCAPEGHSAAWRRFAELREAFPESDRCFVRSISAETVARLHPDAGVGIAGLYGARELRW